MTLLMRVRCDRTTTTTDIRAAENLYLLQADNTWVPDNTSILHLNTYDLCKWLIYTTMTMYAVEKSKTQKNKQKQRRNDLP